MPILRPDIYEHNNPNEPIVDADFVRGGFRTKVGNLAGLYALSFKSAQLKEHSTNVWVKDQSKFYTLIDKNNINNATGWSNSILGSGAPNFSDILGNPTDNTSLTLEFNKKQYKLTPDVGLEIDETSPEFPIISLKQATITEIGGVKVFDDENSEATDEFYNYEQVDNRLDLKVDKEADKSLILDSEITRLEGVTNQTKSSLGLDNVDNTSDVDKPISTATGTALDAKLDIVSTVDVEKVYVKNADGTQSMKPLSEIGSDIIETTLTDFQTLIADGDLKAGSTYKVNGIDNNWCDGFFTALSGNTFDPNGTGLFKNPNYSLYQLWTNQFYRGVTTTVGTPILDEVYTNGIESFIWKTAGLYITNQDSLPDGIYTSGAKSVTVSSADVTNYNVSDIVIFGNKHWKNVNGNLGGKVDELNLDSEWTQVFTNLIPALDLINYDIENDWINERKDSKGNEIGLTYFQMSEDTADNFNYLKTFNWGKDGSDNNKITNWFGVVCNLNFRIYGSNGNGFYIYNNTGIYFSLNNNNGNGFSFYNNAGTYLNFSNNTVSGLNFSNNTVSSLYFSNNTVSSLYFSNNNGSDFNFNYNSGNYFYLKNQILILKTIQFGDFKDTNITTDISTATILFQLCPKSAFRNSANDQIITYYNANNVLVVANITD